ncbi:hypothetical protein PS2_026255 [Malus domestica]
MESRVVGNGRIDTEYRRRVVNRRFQVGPMIRFSQFGKVYLGIDIFMKQLVEIKLENVSTEYPALLYESKVCNKLKGGAGISRVRWFGVEGDYNALVMDVMGVSLDTLFNCCSRKFSLKSINRVEFVHSKSFLHRDMKPNNFLIVASQQLREVYIGCFSLAKQYRDTSTHQHIPYRVLSSRVYNAQKVRSGNLMQRIQASILTVALNKAAGMI